MTTLNDLMDFDLVVQVDASGGVLPMPHVNAPELIDDEVLSDEWTLLDGFSGQQGYDGPMMHQSEYVGGGLETYILSHPGQYVTLVNAYSDPENAVYADTEWAIAFRPTPGESDLPEGYRWANESETEALTDNPMSAPGAVLVPRTVDSSGTPYTQDEADWAVPVD
jgi:hypothetical protein